MTDDKDTTYDLSRRQVLGAAGVVGASGLGAGLGTSALFRDEEQFGNNQLVAGELDLKVDWEQTYNGEPVNAFPDEDADDIQDEISSREDIADTLGEEVAVDSPSVETMFRDQFADLPDDWARPLVELEDVKPGDSGEITFSLHLFDNPGYIRMNGRCLENAENSIIEPEAGAANEDGLGGRVGGELTQAIQVTLWYDDGDNTPQSDEEIIFEGSLDRLQCLLCDGLPLDGQPASPFSSVNFATQAAVGQGPMAADGANEARQCFENSTTHHIGLTWELPRDVGNEVQGDSNRFDLGFYTQQCRNNTGSLSAGDAIEDPPDVICENWKWCKYKVVEILKDHTPSGETCPLQPDELICVACKPEQLKGDGKCTLADGEQTPDDQPYRVYRTPQEIEKLCDVKLESLRDECEDDCLGHHFISPAPLEEK